MSRHAVRARAGERRANLYDEITDKIIAELEAGRVPWIHPWGTTAAKVSLAMPKNGATRRQVYFLSDVRPLLTAEEAERFDDAAAIAAFAKVFGRFVKIFLGEPWANHGDD